MIGSNSKVESIRSLVRKPFAMERDAAIKTEIVTRYVDLPAGVDVRVSCIPPR